MKKMKTVKKTAKKTSAKPRSGRGSQSTIAGLQTARGGKKPLRLIWVEAGSLADNPHNWRRHPGEQMKGLQGTIAEVGWAGALLYNETTGRLIDGHARKAVVNPKTIVPVLVGRWPEERERQILATLDPLGAMAVADADALENLLAETDLSGDGLEELQSMLDDMLDQAKEADDAPAGGGAEDAPASRERARGVSNLFSVIVECKDESDQLKFYNRMKKEKRKCKLYVL